MRIFSSAAARFTSLRLCAVRLNPAGALLLNYGARGDPAKMTGSIFAFTSRAYVAARWPKKSSAKHGLERAFDLPLHACTHAHGHCTHTRA